MYFSKARTGVSRSLFIEASMAGAPGCRPVFASAECSVKTWIFACHLYLIIRARSIIIIFFTRHLTEESCESLGLEHEIKNPYLFWYFFSSFPLSVAIYVYVFSLWDDCWSLYVHNLSSREGSCTSDQWLNHHFSYERSLISPSWQGDDVIVSPPHVSWLSVSRRAWSPAGGGERDNHGATACIWH